MSKQRFNTENESGDPLPVDLALRSGRLLRPRLQDDRDSRGLSVSAYLAEGSEQGWKRHRGSRAFTPGRHTPEDDLHDD